MAFFEELGKVITGTGKEVTTKAKALTETLQLKSQINGEKIKLEEAYAAIGKQFYEANMEPGEAYSKAYEAVRSIREQIAALEIALTQTEGSHVCAECGAKVSKDSAFCGKCGAALKDTSVQAEAEAGEEAQAEAEPENTQEVGEKPETAPESDGSQTQAEGSSE